MDGILTQTNGGARKKSNNKRGHEEVNKSSSIIYHCFIYNSIEHKIYNYPNKDAIQMMFREKAIMVAPKKEDVAINTILVVSTHSQIPKNVVFKEKEPFKNKSLADYKKNKSFNICLKQQLRTYNKRNHQGIYLKLVYKLKLKPT